MWKYTPRQIAAYLILARRRTSVEAAEALSIAANGARGKPKEVNALIKKLANPK